MAAAEIGIPSSRNDVILKRALKSGGDLIWLKVRGGGRTTMGACRLTGIAAMTVLDTALLRRYDRPGPRYTSYPTAPHFTPDFDMAALSQQIAAGNATRKPLSLYVHVPFCLSPCFYCGCNRVITRDRSRGETYLAHLRREIELMAPLFAAGREVVQLHLGGGTPNFLSTEAIGRLLAYLRLHFSFSGREDRDISIEIDPRSVDPADMRALAMLGFNRASFGVQDFDPQVQQAVNRVQSVEETLAVMQAAREAGFRSLNVDLIYGLPKQSREGFARTLETVIAARPDRIAIYGYAHLPVLFKPQKRIHAEDLPDAETRLALLALAMEMLGAAGYRHIGMDHFALPDDELCRAQDAGQLHRNFMGYTTHADSDLLGFGVSAISHIGASFSQNRRELRDYQQAIAESAPALQRGLALSRDDLIRAELIQRIMCQGEVDLAALAQRFELDTAAYFAEDLARLAPLEQDGLVAWQGETLRVTTRGRLLLRHVAMCFDRHLHDAGTQPLRFSRAL